MIFFCKTGKYYNALMALDRGEIVMSHHTRRAILEALVGQRAVPASKLVEQVGEHPIVVERCCYSLQQEGHIRQTAAGVYKLTNNGKECLTDPAAY